MIYEYLGKECSRKWEQQVQDMEAGMFLVWSKNSKEGDVAAAERVKRIVDGGQRGNVGQITQSCRPL